MPNEIDIDPILLKSLALRSDDSLQEELDLLLDKAQQVLDQENDLLASIYGRRWISRATSQEILDTFHESGNVTNTQPQLHLLSLLSSFHQRLLALEHTNEDTLKAEIQAINALSHPASEIREKRYALESRMALLTFVPKYRAGKLMRDIVAQLRRDLEDTLPPNPTDAD